MKIFRINMIFPEIFPEMFVKKDLNVTVSQSFHILFIISLTTRHEILEFYNLSVNSDM